MDKNYIIDLVKKIVNKEFHSKTESGVIVHDGRIQFRCPYCHEGKTKTKKKRKCLS